MPFKRKKPEEAPRQIVVKTKAGFSYIFDLIGKKIYIIAERGMLGHKGRELPTKKEIKNFAKFFGAFVGGTFVSQIPHEIEHAVTALGLGGKVQGWKLGFGLERSEIYIDIDSALKRAIVAIAPQFFEAILGLFLMKEGLKRGNTVYFGYGSLTFIRPTGQVVSSIFADTDFTIFVSYVKTWLIQSFSDNQAIVDFIKNFNEPAAILLTAATIYGTALLGVKYVPKISREFLTLEQTQKIFAEIKRKDPQLYEAMRKYFFLKKAKELRGAVLRKIFGVKE